MYIATLLSANSFRGNELLDQFSDHSNKYLLQVFLNLQGCYILLLRER